MTTVGVSMAKDEADVVAGTVRHMLSEVDRVIIADNQSTDGTRQILDALAGEYGPDRMTVLDDPEQAYYQSAKMTALAERAGEEDTAVWVVPFDADELWTARRGGPIRDVLADLPDVVTVAAADLFNHLCTAVDEPADNPFQSMVWRQRDPAPLRKVAFRWEPGAIIHQGNHGVTLPGRYYPATVLEVRHFPYRSVEQFRSKARNGAAAYAATDLPESEGQHWRSYGRLLADYGPDVLGDVFREHFWFLSPADAGLVRDPAPYLRNWGQP